jgi:hypothetical protein
MFLMDLSFFHREETKTQYSIIPKFHYSNCERSELSSGMGSIYLKKRKLGRPWKGEMSFYHAQ